MDFEIALSRGTSGCDHAALSLHLREHHRELLSLWACLTPCDALAGPEGACAVTAPVRPNRSSDPIRRFDVVGQSRSIQKPADGFIFDQAST